MAIGDGLDACGVGVGGEGGESGAGVGAGQVPRNQSRSSAERYSVPPMASQLMRFVMGMGVGCGRGGVG